MLAVHAVQTQTAAVPQLHPRLQHLVSYSSIDNTSSPLYRGQPFSFFHPSLRPAFALISFCHASIGFYNHVTMATEASIALTNRSLRTIRTVRPASLPPHPNHLETDR